jgi:hypothetical protein
MCSFGLGLTTRVLMRQTALDPEISMRGSGIPLLGSIPWGSHICIFYETDQDLVEAGAAFFKAGLEAGELCVWALPGQFLQARAAAELERRVPDIARFLTTGQMVVVEGYERYLDKGEFALDKIMTGWDALLETGISAGYERGADKRRSVLVDHAPVGELF